MTDLDKKVATILHEESGKPDPSTWEQFGVRLFVGRVDGQLVAPRGKSAFGFDPVFLPRDPAPGPGAKTALTFAEMPADAKNAISHRSSALRLLRAFLQKCH